MRLLPTIVLAASFLLATNARAERIKVLTTGAMRQVVVELVPGFETRTGHQVEVVNDTAGALVKRVDAGEDFDVLVLTPQATERLAGAGRLAASTKLASVGIGVAVKAGEPKPPIATVDQFRQALLAAKHVGYVDPASGGSSGPYLEQVFGRLGVASQVADKAVKVDGGVVARTLLDGRADLVLQPISEILPVAGVTLVGPLPDELQRYLSYSGGVNAASKHRSAADAFMAELSSEDAAGHIRALGMRADR